MDKQKAKQELRTLRDSISAVLGSNDSEDIKASIKQAQDSAREGSKALKKSLIERIKDLPVVTQVSQLGAAGTVAVSTAAVTQVDIAQDRTEIFVAEVAQDVVEERFEVPKFVDNFVDFDAVYSWGQVIIADKVAEAQVFVEEAKPNLSLPPTESETDESEDSKPASSSVSEESDEKPADKQESNKEQSTEEEELEEKDKPSPEDEEEEEEVKPNPDTEEESKERTEDSEGDSDAIRRVETPVDFDDDIKPHNIVSPVS